MVESLRLHCVNDSVGRDIEGHPTEKRSLDASPSDMGPLTARSIRMYLASVIQTPEFRRSIKGLLSDAAPKFE